MQLPDILAEERIAEAAALVRDYYAQPRTGKRFDDWAGGGDSPETVNTLTADDLIAVSFLSVDVPAEAAIGLLETYADQVSDLLAQLPADVDLADLPAADFERLLNDADSPGSRLWHLVRARDTGRWGVGETRASKIIARKRPRLVPIYDSVIRKVTGIPHSGGQWRTWHTMLTGGTGLPERLAAIRQESGITEEIAALRVMDVALWMYGKRQGITPDPADDGVVTAPE